MHRIVAAFALVSVFLSAVHAADGDLDTTYARKGYAYFDWPDYFSQGSSRQYSIAVLSQKDGKIVAVSQVLFNVGSTFFQGVGLKRLLADGTADTTFGDGTVPGQIVIAPQNGDAWFPSGATIDANGNIIVVGSALNTSNSHVVVWKFTSSGVPMPSFGGVGSGMAVIDRGIDAYDTGYAVIAGDGSNEPLGSLFVSAAINNVGAQHEDPAVFFLAADGSPLVTGNGVGNGILANGGRYWQGPSSCPFDTGNLGVFRLTALSFNPQYFAGNSTHYLVAAGDCRSQAVSPKVVVFALGSTSNLDTSFGGNGVSYLSFDADFADSSNFLNGMVVSFDANGDERITLVGTDGDPSGNSHVGLARLRFDGQFDTSFGSGGQLVIDVGACCNVNPDSSLGSALLVQHDGKTIVGGSAETGTTFSKVLLRLNADGGGDSTFGSTGLLSGARVMPQALVGSTYDLAVSLAFTSGEKILFAGSIDSPTTNDRYYSLARVQNDRVFVSTFDPPPVPM